MLAKRKSGDCSPARCGTGSLTKCLLKNLPIIVNHVPTTCFIVVGVAICVKGSMQLVISYPAARYMFRSVRSTCQHIYRGIVTMKCTSCDLPLSPSRTVTSCPRCGTPISQGQKPASTTAQQHYAQAYWGNAGGAQPGASPPYNAALSPVPGYVQGASQPPQQAFPSDQPWQQGQVSQPGFLQGTPIPQAYAPRNPHNTKLGFIVAGLFIAAGGLILVFVYFMAIGLPGKSSNTAVTTSSPVAATPTSAPSVTATPSPTTTTYPGQQYVDKAQMASAINTSNYQPTQLATTFKTNQKIYVTFQLHPAGHNGAICLVWYLNGKQATQYSFAVGANSKLSYAYSTYGGPGSGYVEIYWASTPQCTDQLLAQHVDFTVTP